jgi:hypothetical protein
VHHDASSLPPSIRVVTTGALQRVGAACPGVPGPVAMGPLHQKPKRQEERVQTVNDGETILDFGPNIYPS